jgi:hypothetical protein
VRAQQLTGNAWAEDPGCYLEDEEIGAPTAASSAPHCPRQRITIPIREQAHA